MTRKLWSVIAGLTAALTITGVAWASLPGVSTSAGEDGGTKVTASSSKASLDETTQADSSTSLDNSSTTVETEQESSTTTEGTTPTTTEGTTPTTTEGTTPTTTEGSTSTTTEGEQEHHSSTTIADGTTTRHEDSSSDDQEKQTTTTTAATAPALLNVVQTFQADGAGSVTVQVVAGVMSISSVDPAPGWDARVDDASAHEVDVEFRNGDQGIKLSIEIDGTLRAHVEHN